MSDNKKYYYLKLKDNFFDSDDIKLIEAMPNGYEYSSFYLKLCLMSLKDEGRLLFKGRIPYNEEMLSTITGHNIDIIKSALKLFVEMEILDKLDSGAIFLNDIQNFIGKGSSEAERKRIYRKRIDEEKKIKKIEMGQSPGHRPPELEIELELERKNIPDSEESGGEFYETKKGRKLTDKRLETFNQFWDVFNFKKGKAEAADSWYDIPTLTDSLVKQILESAKIEADNRQSLIDQNKSPKWAQGWLSGKRWEDETTINNSEPETAAYEEFTG